MKLFKRKKKEAKDEIEKLIKRYPRKRRAKMRELYNDYQNGKILQPDKDVDNKQYLMDRK